MKPLVTILIALLFAGNSSAQHTGQKAVTLNKEWIGPGGEYLYIKDDSAYFEKDGGYDCKVRFNDHKLTVLLPPYDALNEAAFNVDLLNDDTLTIDAINDNAYRILQKWSLVPFVDRQHLDKVPFSFQKIFYERSGGGMVLVDYSNMQLEIDSSGSVIFSCQPEKGTLSGTYKGQLSLTQLAQLNKVIKTSQPERFTIPHVKRADAARYTFRFYYKNTMTEASGHGVPHLAMDLLDFLESLPGKMQLEKVSDKYGINTK